MLLKNNTEHDLNEAE